MTIKSYVLIVLVVAFAGYSILVYTVGTAPSTEGARLSSSASIGRELFLKNNCSSCHQLFGLGGYLGPELTTVISQNGKGEEYARAFIKSGTARMPDFGFTDEEVSDLIAFLKCVDSSAITYKQN